MNGILAWQNENGLSYYPLAKDLVVRDFIVDANFVQFDGFVPVLKNINVKSNKVVMTIQFDKESLEVEVPDSHSIGSAVRVSSSNRYLGCITIGPGYSTLKQNYMNKMLTVNIEFLPIVVRSVPSYAGVYSIEGSSGPLVFGADDTIHFVVTGNTVEWSAVALAQAPQDVVALKSINSILPEANNITIYDSDLMKIIPGLGVVNFQLASNDTSNINPSQNFA